jgi:hypothetical protein
MSQQYDNTNTGILSKNDRKTEDWHADYRGTINVEGREYYLDAKIREKRDGSGKFFSLKVRPKAGDQPRADHAPSRTAPPLAGRQGNAPHRAAYDIEDEIPF